MKNYYAEINEANKVTHVFVSEHDAGHPAVQEHFRSLQRIKYGDTAFDSPPDKWVYVEEACKIGDVLEVNSDGCATIKSKC